MVTKQILFNRELLLNGRHFYLRGWTVIQGHINLNSKGSNLIWYTTEDAEEFR